MHEDIRDKASLDHEEVIGLNFIRKQQTYVFRRHFKQGLRSHVMEVLLREDMRREEAGVLRGGLRWYPRARPIKMLRIFRARFRGLDEALEEVQRVKIIEAYLAPEHVARSNEFLVDYLLHQKREFLLCGLQEAVTGEVLDPWSPMTKGHLVQLFSRMDREKPDSPPVQYLLQRVQKGADRFVRGVKKMILQAGHIPDLAGVGNLLLTPGGEIKLVDINNISRVTFENTIPVDDKGYPVCDKSVQALSLLEKKLLGRPIDMTDPIYGTYLDPKRVGDVRVLEEGFHLSMTYPGYNPD